MVLCEQNVTNTTEDEQSAPAVLLLFSLGHHWCLNSAVVSSLPVEGLTGTSVITQLRLSQSTESPTEPTMTSFSMDYGRFF